MTILVPGIVIQELDGLRQSTRMNDAQTSKGVRTQVSVATLARQANDWLLPIINRLECLRGQKMTESHRGNWMYNRAGVSTEHLSSLRRRSDANRFRMVPQLQNDDLILECAHYFVHTNNLRPGARGIKIGSHGTPKLNSFYTPEHVTILTYDKNLQLKAGVEGTNVCLKVGLCTPLAARS